MDLCSYMVATNKHKSSKNTYGTERWIGFCVDLLFLINVVGYFLSQFINGNYKYISLVSSFLFLIFFGYKSKRKEMDYSLFTEIMPKLIHLFGFFILLSSGWALDIQGALHTFVFYEMNAVLFTFFYVYYRGIENGITRIRRVLVCSGLIISVFVVNYVGIEQIQGFAKAGERMEISDSSSRILININSFGFVLLVVCVLFLVSFVDKGFRFWHLSIIPLVVLIFLTGSRKSCVGLFIISFVVFFVSLLKNRKASTFLMLSIGLVSIFSLITLVLDSSFSQVVLRRFESRSMNTGSSVDIRVAMAELGWKIFLNNPLVGCGIGSPHVINKRVLNFDAYLHNNFSELLAGGGLLGFAIYYSKLFLLGKLGVKIFFEKTEKLTSLGSIVLFISVFMLLLIYEFGSVTYNDIGLLYFTLPLYVFYGNYYCTRERRQLNPRIIS